VENDVIAAASSFCMPHECRSAPGNGRRAPANRADRMPRPVHLKLAAIAVIERVNRAPAALTGALRALVPRPQERDEAVLRVPACLTQPRVLTLGARGDQSSATSLREGTRPQCGTEVAMSLRLGRSSLDCLSLAYRGTPAQSHRFPAGQDPCCLTPAARRFEVKKPACVPEQRRYSTSAVARVPQPLRCGHDYVDVLHHYDTPLCRTGRVSVHAGSHPAAVTTPSVRQLGTLRPAPASWWRTRLRRALLRSE